MRPSRFVDRLQRGKPVLLDGGLATQLEAQGCDIGNALWSASLLIENPQAIIDAGRAYLDAGAECLATASYQASREGFAARGLSADEADALMLRSVDLAIQSRDEFLAANEGLMDEPSIAASMGPYGAILHDGSEYHGDYGVSAETLRTFHQTRLALFDAADVDVLALETVPSKMEGDVLADLLAGCETASWVSFSCKDGQHVSDGTPIEEAVGVFRDHPTVVAVGINCTPPQYTSELVHRVRAAVPDKEVMAYPNSGETWISEDNSWTGTAEPLDYATAAVEWVAAGATIIGGCCRTGPSHIRAMRARFSRQSPAGQ